MLHRRLEAHLFLLPVVLFSLLILIYPILSSILLSFQDLRIPSGEIPLKIETLTNYRKMFSSSEFYLTLGNTGLIVAITSILSLIVGVGTAVLVHSARFFRVLAILPWAIPSVTAAVVWGWLFDGSFGLVNWLLVRLSISERAITWNQEPIGAMAMLILLLVWKGYPFITIMSLAGLQALPQSIYEAAAIEGASPWRQLWGITLPLLRPVLTISGLLSALWIFRDYPIVYLLTGGGPYGRTRTLALATYQQAFESFRMSYGASIGVFTLLICLLLSYLVIGLRNREGEL